MFRRFLILALILPVLAFAGCGNHDPGIKGSLGQLIILNGGEAVEISGEQLIITFEEVTSDSRCPQGVICIWAGEVTAKIKIEYGDETYHKTLIKSGGAPDFVTTSFASYDILFDILPYPEEGKVINNYQLKLIVNKSAV